MSLLKKVYLRRGKEESLKRFHPWVFSGAIDRMDDGIDEGDIVDVITHDGDFIARGHFQRGSIMVRVLTFDDEPIDEGYWQQRLSVALDVRRRMNFGAQTDAFRLVHGEGDCLPGLIIDIYGKTAVMQAHSIGMHVCRKEIGKALMAVLSDSIENVYYKSEMTLPFKEEVVNGFLYGETRDDIAIENGLKFHVDWLRGQKTGFFVDQRENRALLEKYSAGRRVLNMFCYTGGFSFYAMRGGAEVVHSVDSSEKAIALTNSNVELNFPNDTRHKAFCEDAFRFLSNIPNGNTPDTQSPYDLIILDPPAFAKHRGALHNALKGYTRLNAKAMEKIAPGGILFTFSCSQVVTKDNFRNAIFTAAAQSGRKIRILHQLHQPADHPINIYHPEGEYLKGLVLYIE